MDKNAILKADFLDILFDNRNKDYGAYNLRKYYDARLLKALSLTIIIAALLVSLIKLMPHKSRMVLKDITICTIYEPIIPELPKAKEVFKPKQQASKPSLKPSASAKIQMTKPNVQVFSSKIEISQHANLPIGSGADIIPQLIPGPAGGQGFGSGGGLGPNEGGTDSVHAPVDNGPLLTADVMPEYEGGKAALYAFLSRNLQSPQELDEGEKVVVRIQFVVDIDGRLRDYTVFQSGGKNFDNEVIRVLRKMPKWKPGKSLNKHVAVYHVLPVTFQTVEQ